MSDDKIARVAESQLLTATNRIVTPLLLTLMAFLGTQVWNDVRAIADSVNKIEINQAVDSKRIDNNEHRIDRLEQASRKP